jgi:hypothetical protein
MILAKSGLRGQANFLGIALAFVLLFPMAAHKAEAASEAVCGPGDRPETGLQGQVPPSARQPPDGFQGFWCGMRKVGQNTIFDRGSYGTTARWDHCAYSSMRNPSDLNLSTTGTAVIDVSVASQPEVVQILRTPTMLRAYAGLKAESGILVGSGQDRTALEVYDVSADCLRPQFLSTLTTPGAVNNHDGWLTPDGKTFYGVPFAGGGILTNPNRVDVHAVNLDDPAHPIDILSWNRTQLPAAARDRTAAADNFHDVSANFDGTRLYMALYGEGFCANGLLILDSSDIALRRFNPQLRFVSFLSWCDQPTPDFGDGKSASAHTTEYVIHENGKEYIVTTDEGPALGGGQGICTQRTYSRLIDISDETNPLVVATWNPEVNNAATCAIGAADNTPYMPHYLGFDDRAHMRLVFYASYHSGLRVVDFRDPARPKEIAYYNSPRHPTLSAVGDTDRNPPDTLYDPNNCFLYSGWRHGGLILLELTNPKYNPCMRRRTSGEGSLVGSGGRGKIEFEFEARRTDRGLKGELELKDRAADARIRIKELTFLGSVRDQCGSVLPTASSVQFEGTGAYNGADASFRVCVQDNGKGKRGRADRFHLVCTAGCTYSAGGDLQHGNIEVRQPEPEPDD